VRPGLALLLLLLLLLFERDGSPERAGTCASCELLLLLALTGLSTRQRCQYLYFCTSKAIDSVHAAGCFDFDRLVNAPADEARQYLYFCTSKASKLDERALTGLSTRLRQYLYFRTSKERKLRTGAASIDRPVNAPGNENARIIERGGHTPRRCQYLYFCASNASKLSTCQRARG
jgi:hypothetical protein